MNIQVMPPDFIDKYYEEPLRVNRISYLKEVLEKSKEDSIQCCLISGAYEKEYYNFQKALKFFEAAKSKNNKYIHTLILIGKTYIEIHKYVEAYDIFNQSIKLYPDNREILRGYTHVCILQKKFKKAKKLLNFSITYS